MQKSEVINSSKSACLWKSLLGGCVFIVLIFSNTTSVLASDTFLYQSKLTKLSGEESFLMPAQDNFFSQGEFDSNLPDPVPGEPEEQEETEKEEKEDTSDDDWKIPLKDYGSLFQSLGKVQTEHFSQSLKNRKTIPLFILFQSWKSFLV